MKRFFLLLTWVSLVLGATAQNINVKSFRALETDMTASSIEGKRIDQNGQVAALIKVVTTEKGFTFEGGTLGIIDTKQRNGEIWVWVPRGLRKITILHQQLGVLRDYMFPEGIESERTYEMVLTTAKVVTTVEEAITQQYLIFQITPPDAALEVDDQLWTVSAEGTARKFVNFGTYTYRVQAPNYHPEAGRVTVDDPENKKTVTITLQPNFGWIEVKGDNLQGASVYIDNALIGKAPCKSESLKSGEHTVKIAKEMYAPYTERVTVTDNKTSVLSPTLTADFAHVTLTVDGDAEIWVNGERRGTHTWTGDLASGTYRIESRKPNHEPTVTTKEITNMMNGQTITLMPPTPIYGSLNVESTPDFAKIFIDGEPMGETPNSISKILIGPHELKLTKDGYADYTEQITITKGERKQVSATLSNTDYYAKGKEAYDKKDYAEAFKWFRPAAEQGNAKAQVYLGLLYEYGYGVAKDNVEAVKWYRKAAEQGYDRGQCNLGFMYETGHGVAKDYAEAVKWYRKAAEQGYDRGQCNLGFMYETGHGVAKDYVEAVKWYRKAAEQGYDRGQNNLGSMYENGYGVAKDYGEAVKWYRKAAEQGYDRGQCNLGYMYESGQGVTKDYAEAVKWFRKAAEQGYARGQCNLGYMYDKGYGVKQDYAEAVKWYRKAAEQGYARGQNNLGFMYKNGYGVKQDYSEAVKWYRKSAEQGYASGQQHLGYMYDQGYGVKQDYAEAMKWYRKAAEQGDVYAQYNLGIMYEYGKGVTKSTSEAKKWYQKAADQGYEDAKNRLKVLK